jgi:hypothetical protein
MICGGERHRFFYGVDPKQPEFPSQQKAIEARVQGNYRVTCGHCGVPLMGLLGHPGGVTDIIWRHDADSWFGTFSIVEPNPLQL